MKFLKTKEISKFNILKKITTKPDDQLQQHLLGEVNMDVAYACIDFKINDSKFDDENESVKQGYTKTYMGNED